MTEQSDIATRPQIDIATYRAENIQVGDVIQYKDSSGWFRVAAVRRDFHRVQVFSSESSAKYWDEHKPQHGTVTRSIPPLTPIQVQIETQRGT